MMDMDGSFLTSFFVKGTGYSIATAVSLAVPTTVIGLLLRSGNSGGAALCFIGFIWLGLFITGIWSSLSSSQPTEHRSRQIRPVDATTTDRSVSLKRHFDRVCPCHVWGETDVEEGRSPEEESDDCCVVCLEPLVAGEQYRKLACGHCFHKPCIDEWWLSKSARRLSCPLCRQKTTEPPVVAERPRRSRAVDAAVPPQQSEAVDLDDVEAPVAEGTRESQADDAAGPPEQSEVVVEVPIEVEELV